MILLTLIRTVGVEIGHLAEGIGPLQVERLLGELTRVYLPPPEGAHNFGRWLTVLLERDQGRTWQCLHHDGDRLECSQPGYRGVQ